MFAHNSVCLDSLTCRVGQIKPYEAFKASSWL